MSEVGMIISFDLKNFNNLGKCLNPFFCHNYGNNNSSKFCYTIIYWIKIFAKFASNYASLRNKSPKPVNV